MKSFKRKILASAIIGGGIALNPGYVAAKGESLTLEEIVVTATRRQQSLEEVPYNISAVSGEALDERGIVSQSDLFRSIPGVTFQDTGPRSGVNNGGLIIRGIASETVNRESGPFATAPVVSTYINETPLYVNLRLNDLERVEVLRGPQGTLYGASSLGGTVRYIYNKPDFENSSLEVTTGIEQTKNADGLSYQADLIANLPISETFSGRLNVGRVDNAGYIDQVLYARNPDGTVTADNGANTTVDPVAYLQGGPTFTEEEGVNDNTTDSVRLALRWVPNEDLDVNFNYIYQEDESGGSQSISYDRFGDDSLRAGAYIPQPFERDVDIFSLDMEYNLGFAELAVSVSDYQSKGQGNYDLTSFYINPEGFGFFFFEVYGLHPRPVIEDISTFDDQGQIAEIRLNSTGDGAIDWTVGFFALDQEVDASLSQIYYGYNEFRAACLAANGGVNPPNTLSVAYFGGLGGECGLADLMAFNDPTMVDENEVYLLAQQSEFSDRALYGELTWHITDKWQATVGARYFEQEFDTTQEGGAPIFEAAFGAGAGLAVTSLSSDDDGTLYKFNTSYQINDAANIYLVWSEGFRRAGANGLPPGTSPILLTYEADTTENTEIGIKGVIDNRYRYSLAAFNIDWDNIQSNTSCTSLFLLCAINAGEAESKGIEFDLNAQVTENLNFTFGYNYTDAELTKVNPDLLPLIASFELGLVINEGARLPGTPKSSLYTGAIYDQYLSDGLTLSYGVNGAFQGSSTGAIGGLVETADSFWIWNGSIELKSDKWSIRAFVNNIADERGITSKLASDTGDINRLALISTPRTVGLNAVYRFGD